MKNGLLFVLVLMLIGTASFVIVSLAQGQQQPEKQFALLMRPTSSEFFKKTHEPEGMRLIDEHFKRLQALTERGVCIFSGRSLNADETAFGIIVVRADSEAAARKIMEDDALVKAGLVRGTVFPFTVVTVEKHGSP